VPHTLLLADDSVTIQRVIELTFADEDVRVVAVSDGDEAIARIEAAPPDIILADVGMPGKSGYEVAQHVKQSPRLNHIPVVLLTGAFEPVDQARAAEAGCEGVLAKPFEPQLVIGRVRELLARSGQGPSQGAVPISAPRPAPPAAAASPVAGASPPPPKPADSFGGPLADQLFGRPPAAAPAAGGGDLNNYFDRLDQAFANLASAAAPTQAPADVDWFQTVKSPGAAPPVPDQWDIAAPPIAPQDLPISYTPEPALAPPATENAASARPAPAAALDHAATATAEHTATARPASAAAPEHAATARQARPAAATHASEPSAAAVVSAPAPAPVPPPMPSLPDAFAALLAAEQKAPHPLRTAEWPGPAPASGAITDDVLDEVTRRVLDRLSDRVVHNAVRDVVSSIAERLVREEIERIKASIR
jgi:CheY-like chemotaxis protein